MLKPTEDQISCALDVVATELPKAAGYRIIVKPLPSNQGLKAGEAERFAELAKLGVVTQSASQTERETRGSHVGILCQVGGGAFKGFDNDWAKEGDVIVFNRYAGERVDIPPGSGDFYHFCNDEDILGSYEGGV